MARPLRLLHAGGWYHLTARGTERACIVSDGRDRRHLCELFAGTAERYRWVIHAYVLMDNHYHLLVETPEPNLSRGMQWLNTSYSVWYNRRHARVGHLFQGRFKAIALEPENWALHLSAYIHLNPVRLRALGLDKSARARQRWAATAPEPEQLRQRLARLRDYRWSSYRAYVGLDSPPTWLRPDVILAFIGRGTLAQRQRAYDEYVEKQIRQGAPPCPWDQLVGQTVLGGKRFLRRMAACLNPKARDCTGKAQLRARPTWEQIVAAIEEVKDEPWERFRDRYGDWGRDLALHLGRKDAGLTLARLGELVGGLDFRTIGWTLKQFKRRLTRDKHLRKLVENAGCKTQNPEL